MVLKRKVVSRVGGNDWDKEKCAFEANWGKWPFQWSVLSKTKILPVGFDGKSARIAPKFGIANKNDSPRVKQTFLYLLATSMGQWLAFRCHKSEKSIFQSPNLISIFDKNEHFRTKKNAHLKRIVPSPHPRRPREVATAAGRCPLGAHRFGRTSLARPGDQSPDPLGKVCLEKKKMIFFFFISHKKKCQKIELKKR